MKSTVLCVLAVLLLMAGAGSAIALTSDDGKYSMNGGTTKFSDPDDDKPAFMTGPQESAAGTGAHQPFTLNVTQGAPGQMPLPGYGNSASQDAFDHAYAHKSQ